MSGKLLKVKVNNLECGTRDRYVNVLGCFRYKNNCNVYVVYADNDTKYSVVYYGSAHVREGIVLCMTTREKREEEVIKEYIYKVIQGEDLSFFEDISLDDVNGIEIISSIKMEVKIEVLEALFDRLMPKKEPVVVEKVSSDVPRKKINYLSKVILILFVFFVLFCFCYLFFGLRGYDNIEKSITCTNNYRHKELNADMEEVNKYNFNEDDELKSVNTSLVYKFNEQDYKDFILKGIYYKYMPSSSGGDWSKDDNLYIFKVITKIDIDSS